MNAPTSPLPRVTHARVINRNDFTIEDRCDGVPYVFDPGKVVTVPLDAAALIFGMPVDQDGNVTFAVDHGYLARRWGWNVLEKRDEKELTSVAMERLVRETAKRCANIKVEPVSYVLREVTADDASLPPPRDGATTGDGLRLPETADLPTHKVAAKRGRKSRKAVAEPPTEAVG